MYPERPAIRALWRADLGLLSHTHREHRLLRSNGWQSIEITRSAQPPSGTAPNSRLLAGGAVNTSARRFPEHVCHAGRGPIIADSGLRRCLAGGPLLRAPRAELD